MIGKNEDYIEFFSMLNEFEHKAFGEITPAYALLEPEHFKFINKIHPHVKYIYLMRNPIARITSANQSRYRRHPEEKKVEVKTFINQTGVRLRSNYPKTILSLRKSTPRDNVLYLFFEDLFSDTSIQKLTKFIGVDFVPGEYTKKAFPSADKMVLSDTEKRDVFTATRYVYNFIHDEFGDSMPESWRKDMERYG